MGNILFLFPEPLQEEERKAKNVLCFLQTNDMQIAAPTERKFEDLSKLTYYLGENCKGCQNQTVEPIPEAPMFALTTVDFQKGCELTGDALLALVVMHSLADEITIRIVEGNLLRYSFGIWVGKEEFCLKEGAMVKIGEEEFLRICKRSIKPKNEKTTLARYEELTGHLGWFHHNSENFHRYRVMKLPTRREHGYATLELTSQVSLRNEAARNFTAMIRSADYLRVEFTEESYLRFIFRFEGMWDK
jgi:hypothetical protein